LKGSDAWITGAARRSPIRGSAAYWPSSGPRARPWQYSADFRRPGGTTHDADTGSVPGWVFLDCGEMGRGDIGHFAKVWSAASASAGCGDDAFFVSPPSLGPRRTRRFCLPSPPSGGGSAGGSACLFFFSPTRGQGTRNTAGCLFANFALDANTLPVRTLKGRGLEAEPLDIWGKAGKRLWACLATRAPGGVGKCPWPRTGAVDFGHSRPALNEVVQPRRTIHYPARPPHRPALAWSLTRTLPPPRSRSGGVRGGKKREKAPCFLHHVGRIREHERLMARPGDELAAGLSPHGEPRNLVGLGPPWPGRQTRLVEWVLGPPEVLAARGHRG